MGTGGAADSTADAGAAAGAARELLATPTCQQQLTTARSQAATCQKSVTNLNNKLKAAQVRPPTTCDRSRCATQLTAVPAAEPFLIGFAPPPHRPQAATKTANSNLASKNTEIASLKKQLTAAKSATTTTKAAVRPAMATATDACGTLQDQLDAKTAELTLALQKLANLNKLLATTEGLLKSTQSSLDIANDKLIAAQSAEGAPSVPCLLCSAGTLLEHTA